MAAADGSSNARSVTVAGPRRQVLSNGPLREFTRANSVLEGTSDSQDDGSFDALLNRIRSSRNGIGLSGDEEQALVFRVDDQEGEQNLALGAIGSLLGVHGTGLAVDDDISTTRQAGLSLSNPRLNHVLRRQHINRANQINAIRREQALLNIERNALLLENTFSGPLPGFVGRNVAVGAEFTAAPIITDVGYAPGSFHHNDFITAPAGVPGFTPFDTILEPIVPVPAVVVEEVVPVITPFDAPIPTIIDTVPLAAGGPELWWAGDQSEWLSRARELLCGVNYWIGTDGIIVSCARYGKRHRDCIRDFSILVWMVLHVIKCLPCNESLWWQDSIQVRRYRLTIEHILNRCTYLA